MGNETKNFHFIEMDLLVYFPKEGNKGKYLGYNVLLIDRKKVAAGSQENITLKEILETPRFEKSYPHTVGYYKESSGEGAEFTPEYLEMRKISSIEDFWLFLNALDI
jgi:hypothetical protein